MSDLKVAFIPTGVSGVVFYRAWQPCGALTDAKGIQPVCWWYKTDQYELHPWESELREYGKGSAIFAEINAACEWADVVVWMALHHPDALDLFRHMKLKHDKLFLAEIDDYVFSIPTKNDASNHFKPGSALVSVAVDQFKESDGMIVSTPDLAEMYKGYNKNISVVENCIDTGLWKVSEKKPKDKVRIGWVGGGTHEEDHEIIKDVVFELLEEHKDIEFYFMHGVPRFFRNHERIKYTLDFRPVDKYPRWVMKAGFDIGVAPLEDNTFNRGKSNLRWLEYSAMGIPTVASPLPHFKRSIEHGKTGFFSDTKDEWKYNLKQLIENESLRHSIGLNARREVEGRWSIRNLRETYKSVLERAYNAKLYQVGTCDAGVGTDRGHIGSAMVGG